MKKLKILFWKLLQAYNEYMIKWSIKLYESDLKLFEKRSLLNRK